jgi:hypothetical protein
MKSLIILREEYKMEKNEIVIDGKEYVLKSTIKTNVLAKKNTKGLEYCIVRTYSAGVFAGYFDRKTKGQEGTVFNARRLWYWDGANSLSELSVKGVSKPDNCKFAVEVSEVDLKQIVEILPCTENARLNIKLVKEWVQ